jgi:DNA-binding GntR family transcriptional regulator
MATRKTTAQTKHQRLRRGAKSALETADWIRDRIRTGRLAPGQRLIEADLMEALGASRSKVREALRRLETDGLVTIEEFRGASVKRIGHDEMRQIYRARMALEGLAAADFAAAEAPELKQRLQDLQDRMDEAIRGGTHDQFAKLNSEWHALITEGSGNLYIARFLSRLTVPIYRLLFSTFYTRQRIEAANSDHQVITAAIVGGRTKDAERAMRKHISDGLAALADIDAHFDL